MPAAVTEGRARATLAMARGPVGRSSALSGGLATQTRKRPRYWGPWIDSV